MKKKIVFVFSIILLFVICCFILRLDRLGFSNIHWNDFVYYNGKLYISVQNTSQDRLEVEKSEIGDKVGEVKYTLQGNVRSSFYRYRNFDASFLERGTPIYLLNGKYNKNKLVIYSNEHYYLYQYDEVN